MRNSPWESSGIQESPGIPQECRADSWEFRISDPNEWRALDPGVVVDTFKYLGRTTARRVQWSRLARSTDELGEVCKQGFLFSINSSAYFHRTANVLFPHGLYIYITRALYPIIHIGRAA